MKNETKIIFEKIVTIYRHGKAQKAFKSKFGYIKLHFASMVIIETFQQNVQIITHFLLSLHNRCQILRLLQASRQSKSELQFYTGCPNKFWDRKLLSKIQKRAKLEFDFFLSKKFVKLKEDLIWTFTNFFVFRDIFRFFAKYLLGHPV